MQYRSAPLLLRWQIVASNAATSRARTPHWRGLQVVTSLCSGDQRQRPRLLLLLATTAAAAALPRFLRRLAQIWHNYYALSWCVVRVWISWRVMCKQSSCAEMWWMQDFGFGGTFLVGWKFGFYLFWGNVWSPDEKALKYYRQLTIQLNNIKVIQLLSRSICEIDINKNTRLDSGWTIKMFLLFLDPACVTICYEFDSSRKHNS